MKMWDKKTKKVTTAAASRDDGVGKKPKKGSSVSRKASGVGKKSQKAVSRDAGVGMKP